MGIAEDLILIILSASAGFGIGRMLGFSTPVSLALGMVISLSSTMVVLKTLMNQGLMRTLSAKAMIGILIIQDLAAIPLSRILAESHVSIINCALPEMSGQ